MRSKQKKHVDTDPPAWLDEVLGCSSRPFSFRNGGSVLAGGGAVSRPAPAAAARPRGASPLKTTGSRGGH